MPNPSTYFAGNFSILAPQACLLDTTPPTFAGITGLVHQDDGSLLASWGAASDANPPIRYAIYVSQDSNPPTHFSPSNFLCYVKSTSFRVFQLPNGTVFQRGQTYYVGVRAEDSQGNIETNLVVLNDVANPLNAPLQLGDIPEIAKQVWNRLRSLSTVPGSFGESLQGVVTAARANLLDNLSRLDVLVSSRGSSSQSDTIIAYVDQLEIRLTAGRASNLDNLDAAITTRAASADVASVPAAVASLVPAAVWDVAQASHVASGSTGAKLNSLGGPVDVSSIAAAVWNEAKTSHTTTGTFGALLDQAISSRSSDADMQAIKGSGFVATDSLHDLKAKVNLLPTSAGDATLANQNTIISQLAAKASQASITTLQNSVNAIPINPLLTTDARLNRLDVNVSTRLADTDFQVIKGAGFNASTDTLEAIRDAVAASVDLTPVTQSLSDIKGAGFATGTDSLSALRPKVDAAKSSADAAASIALDAKNAALGAATQAQASTIIAGVAAIPTNPVLTNDVRITRLDANISSRAAATDLAAAMGGTFNPATDSLEKIVDLINSKTYSNATLANQVAILNAIAGTALESTAQSILTRVTSIPTNPALTTDVRFNNLDAAVSSRASDTDMQAVKGAGFTTSDDSLAALKDAIVAADLDLSPVLTQLSQIKGAGFSSGQDDLHILNNTAINERAQIYSAVQGVLSTGEGF
jgi:hypothetical protein